MKNSKSNLDEYALRTKINDKIGLISTKNKFVEEKVN